MSYPRMVPEDKALILDYFANGARPLDIAQTMNVRVAQVYSVLREQGIATGHRGRPGVMDKFTSAEIEQLAQDYEETEKPVHEILREYGISYQQLYSILGVLALPTRNYSVAKIKSKKARIDRAIQMYLDDKTIDEIQLETGVGNSYLYRELRRRGMQTKQEKRNESEADC